MAQTDDDDREEARSRSFGCLAALVFVVLIAVPLFFLNGIGECLPKDGSPKTISCDAEKQEIALVLLLGSPAIAALIGWSVNWACRRKARASRPPPEG